MSPGTTALPRLHVVTDDDVLRRPDWRSVAGSILKIGGPAVALHVRGPRTDGAVLFRLVTETLEVATESSAMLVVNDRVDIALAAGVGAVQLGRRSLRVDEARRILGASARIGRSVHTPAEASAARLDGADFVLAGNIYRTLSHPDREGLGAAALRSFAEAAEALPVIGIGGVTSGRAGELRREGAYGVAAIRGVWDASDPVAAVMDYIAALAEVS